MVWQTSAPMADALSRRTVLAGALAGAGAVALGRAPSAAAACEEPACPNTPQRSRDRLVQGGAFRHGVASGQRAGGDAVEPRRRHRALRRPGPVDRPRPRLRRRRAHPAGARRAGARLRGAGPRRRGAATRRAVLLPLRNPRGRLPGRALRHRAPARLARARAHRLLLLPGLPGGLLHSPRRPRPGTRPRPDRLPGRLHLRAHLLRGARRAPRRHRRQRRRRGADAARVPGQVPALSQRPQPAGHARGRALHGHHGRPRRRGQLGRRATRGGHAGPARRSRGARCWASARRRG